MRLPKTDYLKEKTMTLVRWEPFHNLVSIQDRMNRIFDDAFRGQHGASEDDWALGGNWAPAVDIFEHEGNIVLKAELPGIEAKDVDIRVENNVLSLRGERKFESEVKREDCHRVERAYGSFSRSFTLPNVVDTEKIKAEYKDGVLQVTLPQKEEAKPKQISIAVGK
jgi:HSP20 family protein